MRSSQRGVCKNRNQDWDFGGAVLYQIRGSLTARGGEVVVYRAMRGQSAPAGGSSEMTTVVDQTVDG